MHVLSRNPAVHIRRAPAGSAFCRYAVGGQQRFASTEQFFDSIPGLHLVTSRCTGNRCVKKAQRPLCTGGYHLIVDWLRTGSGFAIMRVDNLVANPGEPRWVKHEGPALKVILFTLLIAEKVDDLDRVF